MRDRFCTAQCSLTDYRRSFPVSLRLHAGIPTYRGENIGVMAMPAFTVRVIGAAISPFCFPVGKLAARSDYPVTRDGRRLSLLLYGVIGASGIAY